MAGEQTLFRLDAMHPPQVPDVVALVLDSVPSRTHVAGVSRARHLVGEEGEVSYVKLDRSFKDTQRYFEQWLVLIDDGGYRRESSSYAAILLSGRVRVEHLPGPCINRHHSTVLRETLRFM